MIFQSLRFFHEINFWDSGSVKSAIFTLSKAQKFEFLPYLKVEIYQINKIQRAKNGKNSILELLDSLKLISREI